MNDDPLASLSRLPDVSEALASARAAVDGLLGHRLLRRRSAEVSAEAGLRCARASAALAGHETSLAEVRDGSPDPVVQGAVRIATGVGSLVDTIDRAPLQALARLHVLASRGLTSDEELGRPRADPGGSARLAGLAELVAGRRTGSALLLASVVHGELLALQAFTVGNDVVARAASRLVMIARGLDPKAVCAPEVGHWELKNEYRLAAGSYLEGDVRPWLLHCCEAVRLGAVESLALCESIIRTAESQA